MPLGPDGIALPLCSSNYKFEIKKKAERPVATIFLFVDFPEEINQSSWISSAKVIMT